MREIASKEDFGRAFGSPFSFILVYDPACDVCKSVKDAIGLFELCLSSGEASPFFALNKNRGELYRASRANHIPILLAVKDGQVTLGRKDSTTVSDIDDISELLGFRSYSRFLAKAFQFFYAILSPVASLRSQERRLSVCASCPELNSLLGCNLCGCPSVEAKARYENSSCRYW